MRRIGAYLATAALAAVVLSPTPSLAFGLSLGPFHIGLPLFGFPRPAVHRHRIALNPADRRGGGIYDKASLGSETAPPGGPALLYPVIALPGLYDAVFWPDRAPQWPLGYEAIFRSAFAKSPLDNDARACQEPDRTAAIIGRIRAGVRPRPAQLPLLQKLGEALGMASAYLARACPKEIPAQPVARINLIQSQIQALSMAIDLVRPPLQQFEQSLDARQRARFDAMRSPSAGACAATPTNWSVEQIDQSVQPGDDQRAALSDLREAFASAAADLDAHCPKALAPSPLRRLEAIEARLDASWRAALAMQVALAKFETRLSDQQRTRFEAMDVAEAR